MYIYKDKVGKGVKTSMFTMYLIINFPRNVDIIINEFCSKGHIGL